MRSPATASSSSGRTATPCRPCPPTSRCSAGGSPSTPACGTTARRSRPTSGCWRRCCATAATRPAASCRRACCGAKPASPGLRLLRRSATARVAVARRDRGVPAAAAELTAGELRRDGAESEAIAERWLAIGRIHAPVPVPAAARAACAVRGARAVRRARALRRRDRLRGRNRRPSRAVSQDQPALRSVHDRARVGSRRGAGRPRRAGPRPVPVRRSDSRAAHRQAGRRSGRGPPRRRSRPAGRHRADGPRPGQGAGSRQPARAIAQDRWPTGPGSGRPTRPCTRKRSYGRNHFGWSALESLTDGALPVHPGAARGAVRSRRPIRGSGTTSRTGRPVVDERRTALKRLLGEADEAPDAADAADPKDKREVVDTVPRGRGLVAERKWPQAIDMLPEDPARRTGARRASGASWAMSRRWPSATPWRWTPTST